MLPKPSEVKTGLSYNRVGLQYKGNLLRFYSKCLGGDLKKLWLGTILVISTWLRS